MNRLQWSRRRFLAVTSAAAAVASLPTAAVLKRVPGYARWRPTWLGFEDLVSLQGERVRLIGAEGATVPARVIDVADRSTRHAGVTVRQYSILMRTGLREPVASGQFRIQHSTWGEAELFCSPVFSNSRGIQYEATLSRLHV